MQYEPALDRLCDDISALIADASNPSPGLFQAAARATRHLAIALRMAAGSPEDRLWYDALTSLDRFLVRCHDTRSGEGWVAMHRLRTFVDENSAASAPAVMLPRAS
jgi:hypothetical protein